MLERLYASLRRDTRGATAIEYALIAGGVAIAAVGAISTLGSHTSMLYASIVSNMH